MKKIHFFNIFILYSFVCLINANASSGLIPWPKSITENTGYLELTVNSKIKYSDASLETLATILKEDIKSSTGLDLPISNGNADAGDIELGINNSLSGEAYTLTVDDKVVLKGANYRAAVWGTSTLLQAISGDGNIQKMTVNDSPEVNYRGLMVDLARKWHTVNDVKSIINLCRFYKINYLQLHLTDDASFTFPSTAYPKLSTPGRSYTLAEMNELETYSQQRGVTIIPELDVPGHAAAMCSAYPDLFGSAGKSNVINFASTAVWQGVETLINELSAVFQAAPYIHIGGDEVDFSGLDSHSDFTSAISTYNVQDVHGLFNYFVNQVNSYVKAKGKKTMVWEGFNSGRTGNAKMNTDVIVCPFDNYTSANTYAGNGHDVLNTSWFPLYLVPTTYVPAEKIYEWDITQFGRYASASPFSHTNVYQYTMNNPSKIIGAQTCSWEQEASYEIPSLRGRLCTMSERVWNSNAGKSYSDYSTRFETADKVFQNIVALSAPEAITPSAGYDIHPDKIVIRWRPEGNFPNTYTLYRNTTNNSNTATAILSNTTDLMYTDFSATEGQSYYYWIKASNTKGTSAFGNPATGRRGTSAIVTVNEDFNYASGAGLNSLNGGTGFESAWNVVDNNGKATISNASLTYPGITTTGKSLTVDMTGAGGSFTVERSLDGSFGAPGSEIWVSFLMQANHVESGHAFLMVGNEPVGKQWGNGVRFGDNNGGANAQLALKNGETNLLVLKIECFEGNDNVYIWTNPTAGTQPDKNATNCYFTNREDIGTNPLIKINVQQYGSGIYQFDEIKIGTNYPYGGNSVSLDAPGNLMVSDITENTAKLSWTASNSAEAIAYNVFEGANYIGRTTTTSFDVSDLASGRSYSFSIKATDDNGNFSAATQAVEFKTLGSSAPPADALAVESFDYASNNSLVGLNGGTGWADAYTQQSTTAGKAIISSTGLDYPNLLCTGGSLQLTTSTSDNLYFRNTTEELFAPNTTVWVSYLLMSPTSLDGSGQTWVRPIRGIDGSGFGWHWNSKIKCVGEGSKLGATIAANTTYLLVAKFECTASNVVATYWENPTVGVTPTSAEAFATRTFEQASVASNQITIWAGYGSKTVYIDELRIGDSYASVTPTKETSTSVFDDPGKENNVILYPNPAKEVLNVELSTPSSCKLFIYNSMGSMVYTSQFTGTKTRINTNTFAKGIYFLKISGITYRFVVK